MKIMQMLKATGPVGASDDRAARCRCPLPSACHFAEERDVVHAGGH
jgi:hypothetical protein